jgi:hypothetical protein
MNGPEHVARAEQLMGTVTTFGNEILGDEQSDGARMNHVANTIAAAQVHASLAAAVAGIEALRVLANPARIATVQP